MNADRIRRIERVTPLEGERLRLVWSDGAEAEIALDSRIRSTLGNASDFAAVTVGDWGHSLVWPNGAELGADSLWLDTLSASGRDDARQFLEWRLANALSLSGAAQALGLSRRSVAYYSNGERPVPKTVLLACKGWDATHPRKAA